MKSPLGSIGYWVSKSVLCTANRASIIFQRNVILGILETSFNIFILDYVDQRYSGLCRPPILWPLWVSWSATLTVTKQYGLQLPIPLTCYPFPAPVAVWRALLEGENILRYVDRQYSGLCRPPQKGLY